MQSPARSLIGALQSEGVALIAEVKKASPSRGLLAPDFDPVALARTYAENGAAAISVLTETPHFQGRLEFLREIREDLGSGCPPLLRKDFIFDEYQVWEARAWGADAILLIASILDEDEVRMLRTEAQNLGMDALVEAHTEAEVKAALSGGSVPYRDQQSGPGHIRGGPGYDPQAQAPGPGGEGGGGGERDIHAGRCGNGGRVGRRCGAGRGGVGEVGGRGSESEGVGNCAPGKSSS